MVVEELITLVGFEETAGSAEVRARTEEGLNSIRGLVVGLAAVSGAAVGVIGAVGAGIASFTKDLINNNSALASFIDTTAGVTAEQVQALEFAVQIFGGSQEDIFKTLETLQKRIGEFRRGGGGRVLYEVGVDFDGNPLEVFDRLAERFSALDVSSAQNLGQKLGLDRNVIALLQSGTANIAALKAEAETYGTIVGTDVGETAQEIEQTFLRVQYIIRGIVTQISIAIVPEVKKLNDRFLEFLKINREVIKARIERIFLLAVDGAKLLFTAVNFLVSTFIGFSGIVGGAEKAVYLLIAAWAAARIASVVTGIAIAAMNLPLLTTVGLMLAVPAAVVAALAALYLIGEDLYVYFKGGDSLIGLMLDRLQELYNEALTEDSLLGAILRQADEFFKLLGDIRDVALELKDILIDISQIGFTNLVELAKTLGYIIAGGETTDTIDDTRARTAANGTLRSYVFKTEDKVFLNAVAAQQRLRVPGLGFTPDLGLLGSTIGATGSGGIRTASQVNNITVQVEAYQGGGAEAAINADIIANSVRNAIAPPPTNVDQ